MGRPREFDIEEAIATATKLFWRGFDRTSLSELTGALGISPASFYVAFKSKEALFRQIVERYLLFQAEAFDSAFLDATALDGTRALLRGYIDVVTDVDHAPGCLVVNNSPSDVGDGLQRWLAAHRRELRGRLEGRFTADRTAGKLSSDVDPAAMAHFVVTLAGGLAVEAQSGAERRDLYAMVDFALRA